jgi:hypothetical protein
LGAKKTGAKAGDSITGGGGEGMTWTTEKPTVPGWYWYREIEGEPEILAIYKDNGQLLISGIGLQEFPGEWAGPLKPPA